MCPACGKLVRLTMMLKPGDLFAERYRIHHEIARGGMGVVYAAEHVETEQPIALKLIFPSILDSSDAVESFKLEARVAARLDNEHVVRVYDAGLEPESKVAFLAMELLNGQTLSQMVAAQGPLPRDVVSMVFRDLGTALHRAHGYADKQGVVHAIVHRDLKPDNLFLSRRPNGEPILKILDFGIAKVLTTSAQVSAQIKGTPLFMAYEQLASEPVTPQTDIWSLGLIAFYLLVGRSYWKSASATPAVAAAVFGEILTSTIVPASKRAAELGMPGLLPAGFDEWFARCVVRAPSKRFGSAREATAALREILGDPTADTLVANVPVRVSDAASVPMSGRAASASSGTFRGIASPPQNSKARRSILVAVAVGIACAATITGVLLTRSGPTPQNAGIVGSASQMVPVPESSAAASSPAPGSAPEAPVAAPSASSAETPARRRVPTAAPPAKGPAKADNVWGER